MQTSQTKMHVLIAGCGPAGLLLAASCAGLGLDVMVVAPELTKGWPNRYGVWASQFAALGLEGCLEQCWPKAAVWLSSKPQRVFEDVAYASVSNESLQAVLRARCQEGQASFLEAKVVQVKHLDDHTEVTTNTGQVLCCEVFVDATGYAGGFTRRVVERPATAFQTAYGILADIEGGDFDPDTMVWMDFRDPGPGAAPLSGGVPTFLYAMPIAPGRVFLEETVLVSTPEIPPSALRARLMARLAHRGIKVCAIHDVERCRIPMNTPMPCVPQRTLALGGAASMVHPATGYSLVHSAQVAPRLAQVLAHALQGGERGEALSAVAWDAIWPEEVRRARELYGFGASLLASMDAARLCDFFDAFFRLPQENWRGYMSWGLSPWQIGKVMWGVYTRCTPELRGLLRRAAMSNPGPVARGWLGLGSSRGEAGMGGG